MVEDDSDIDFEYKNDEDVEEDLSESHDNRQKVGDSLVYENNALDDEGIPRISSIHQSPQKKNNPDE